MIILCYQTFDIADDADGGVVVADDVFALDFDDVDVFSIHENGVGFLADMVESDIATPIAEKEGGVATIVDKHGIVCG